MSTLLVFELPIYMYKAFRSFSCESQMQVNTWIVSVLWQSTETSLMQQQPIAFILFKYLLYVYQFPSVALSYTFIIYFFYFIVLDSKFRDPDYEVVSVCTKSILGEPYSSLIQYRLSNNRASSRKRWSSYTCCNQPLPVCCLLYTSRCV